VSIQGGLGNPDLSGKAGGGDAVAGVGLQHLGQSFQYLLAPLGSSRRHGIP
jgi:hypothetical protein